MNHVAVGPGGAGNASRIALLPQPNIAVATIPQFK
jgi:hypothetical protein